MTPLSRRRVIAVAGGVAAMVAGCAQPARGDDDGPMRFTYGPHPSQYAELSLPAVSAPAPVVVVVHGGYWRSSYGAELGRPLAADLVGRGFAALNVEYRTDLANGGNLSARVGYSYQSEVWPTTDLSPAIRQDGYGLLGAGVTWKVNDTWQLSLQGSNLADEEYRTTGYNIASYGVLTGFYGPPRQYTLTARYDF